MKRLVLFLGLMVLITACGQRNQRRPLVNLKETPQPREEGGVLGMRDKFFTWLDELESSPIAFPENQETLTYEVVYNKSQKISFFPTGSNLRCDGHFKKASIKEKFLHGNEETGLYSFSLSKKLQDFELEIGYGKEARESCENFVSQHEVPGIKRDVHLERQKEQFISSIKSRLETSLLACRANDLYKGLRCVDIKMDFLKTPYRQLSWKEDGALLSINYTLETSEGARLSHEVKMFFSPIRYYLPKGNLLAKKGQLLTVKQGQEEDSIFEIRDLKLLFSPN